MAFNNLQDTRTLWERCDLDTLSKAVLQVLINHRNSCSGLCNPGTTRIASETGMSTRSVKSRIALLTAQGVLKIVIKGTFTTPSGYAINLEGVATSECTSTGAGDSLVKDIHQTGAGDSLGVVQEAHEGSAGDAPKQISNKERNKERNKEEPLPPPSPLAKREAQTHLFSLSEIPDASKEKTRTHQAFKPPELGVELTESAFRDWMTVRKAKHSPLTETAWKHFKAQVLRSELSIQQAVELCATKGWISINAEWQAVKDYQAEFDSRSSNDRKVDFVIKALGLTDNRKETEK